MLLVATMLDNTVLKSLSLTVSQGCFLQPSLSLAKKLLQSVLPQSPISNHILILYRDATCPRQWQLLYDEFRVSLSPDSILGLHICFLFTQSKSSLKRFC